MPMTSKASAGIKVTKISLLLSPQEVLMASYNQTHLDILTPIIYVMIESCVLTVGIS